MQNVVVVGAGIIGAALASRLARMGADVTVLEAASNAGGAASARSFSWLNSAWGNTEPYHRLRVASLKEWQVLAKEVSGISPDWCGSILWDLPEDELTRSVPMLESWGYNVALVDGAFARTIEPALRQVPEISIHAPDEGMIDAVATTEAFLADASAHGAKVRFGASVAHLATRGATVTGVDLADGDRVDADHVVLAAGVETAGLIAPLGPVLPVTSIPGLLALTKPLDKVLNGLVISPRAHVRQRPDGRLIAGTDFAGADPGEFPDQVASEILETLNDLINMPSGIELESYSVGYRPTPEDGVSIAGCVQPGVSVAVTHSGITLAPILAKLLASEILTGARDPLLASFGPERF